MSKFVKTNNESDAAKNAQENVENDVTICCEEKEHREMGIWYKLRPVAVERQENLWTSKKW